MIRSASRNKMLLLIILTFALMQQVFLLAPEVCHAICATVKIEIRQELTLERQAFDAHMRINNGLSHLPIENVEVTVNFADEQGDPVLASSNPDDTSALFFIRIDTMENIDNVEGSGTVAPETSADIHWLIIPAPGASNGLESGELYYVGASLQYTVGGETETVEVTPDFIFVKPMPQLVLDYFLPTDVYGDDAWTDTVEAPVPFSLGLRVSNKGYGYARSLTVESAQPKIVENEMGLLIGFQIDGSKVNGQSATDSLLVDLGDIAPNSAGTARWIMHCTLSGRFIEFGAQFSHADELGGKMTSLIAEDDINTHFLVHDVLVDAIGRDNIEDFLARDDDVLRIYESNNTRTDVTDQSQDATLTQQGSSSQNLLTPPTDGFMYVQLSDPYSGNMLVKEAIRSDGKRILNQNVWLSKTRVGSGPWQYFINLFDYNTPGAYTIVFQSKANIPQPPVIMYIPERTRVEGEQLSFIVEATDPNGGTPALEAERLPIGAAFMDQGDGSGIFDWTPAVGQAGRYVVKFIATDGVLESSRQAIIRILSQDDSDGDGMLDSWEMNHFGTLERDGSGDFDGDGISDLDEFLNGLDPKTAQSVPSVPEIISPPNGAHVGQLIPSLQIANSIDPEGDTIVYQFEVYADAEYKVLVAVQSDVAPQSDTTIWTMPDALSDNTAYHWRVKAQDATGSSNWAYGHFFINTQNDPPTAPAVSFPADGTSVDNTAPTLAITNGSDPDGDVLTYTFELYADSNMDVLITSASGITAGDSGTTSWHIDALLDDGYWYYWRAIADDGQGAQTPAPLAAFQVDTSNSAPGTPGVNAPASESETINTFINLIVDNAVDADGDNLTYIFEIDTTATFNSPDRQTSDHLLPGDGTTLWSIENLQDNTLYHWRAKAHDGLAESPWAVGSFFVNTFNDTPPAPTLKNPGQGAWVNTKTPQLAVHPVCDPDADSASYRFEIYTDSELNEPAGYIENSDPVWLGISALQANCWYFWRVQTVDEHGIGSQWSEIGSFFVKINSVDLAPQLFFIEPTDDLATNAQGILIHWNDTDPDSNAIISLYYDADNSGADGTLIVENIQEDPDGTSDYFTWDISGLEGTYYIYAVIADTVSSETIYCPAAVTIDHTPPTITADPAGGAYDGPLDVALTTNETAQIYYTLDNSEPDINSAVYDMPIPIADETTLKCMAIDATGNQCAVITETYTFAASDITVSVSTDTGRVLDGIRVYAFTDAGSYTGKHGTTDSSGEVHFNPEDFTPGDYNFRVDYLGCQFWSATHSLPDTRSIHVVIIEAPVAITVTTTTGPAEGVRVYLFSDTGHYLGQYQITDINGQVIFDLPAGEAFSFRADLYGNQYWSSTITVDASGNNTVPVNAGGGLWRILVNKAIDDPLIGVKVYLFNTIGNYLGHYATTDGNGEVIFDVAQGDYKVRVDYLGYQFWSADTAVTTDTQATVTIAHQQIQVSVNSQFEQTSEPLQNVKIYLFTPSGRYLSWYAQTDTQGKAYFELPQKDYKVRADFMHQQFWSTEFIWQDPVVTVPMADARITVTGSGTALEDVRVYAFTAGNSYLGRYSDTNIDGQAIFRLPEGDYKFRADYQGNQFWSTVATLTADQVHPVGISTGGGTFTFSVSAGQDQPLAGVNCYVFDENNAYLGLYSSTDGNGEVTFDLADGVYQFRIDYLGHRFWSDTIQIPDTLSAELAIAHTPVDVTVQTGTGPATQTRVYLFTDSGAYQGRYLETNTDGQATFDLPAGGDFMFRADLLGNQYWSDIVNIPQSTPASVIIDAGGGQLQLTVEDSAANPMPNLKVYLFSDTGTYLGSYLETNTDGMVTFDTPAGDYKLRVDYLGYSFWTDIIQMITDTAITLPIDHQQTAITVQGRFQSTDTPLTGIRVYLFTATGSYLNQYQDTDASGQVIFNLPPQDYMVRADYMGQHYWSGNFNQHNTAITIPMADAEISVTGAGLPQADIPVYLFSETGTYLGLHAATDLNGQVMFRIPAGTYQVRADYQGNQYWSGVVPLNADQVNSIVVSGGGGTFSLNITQADDAPMPGLKCYVFDDSGIYIGLHGATNSQGQVFFDLADGIFQFRIDYLGYPYWSQPVTVPSVLEETMTIAHQDITITLSGTFEGSNQPLSGQRLYLFTPGSSYMGQYQTTNTDGQAIFHLPDQEYKLRADYLGAQHWSPVFRFQDTNITIQQGAVNIHVHRNGAHADGVRVYLFTPSGAYLNRYEVTDTVGLARFILPQGIYKFRADADGLQHWTTEVTVIEDQTATVQVNLD